jgi:uncharacterized protein (PEP-CTERM system associated)
VNSLRKRLLLGSALCALPGPVAQAADIQLSPHASIEETYTDNALSSSSDRQYDWITTAGAGLGVRGDGKRVKLDAGYDIYRDTYARQSKLSGLRHHFLGGGDAELLEDMLYIEARGALSQGTPGDVGPLSATERTLQTGQTLIANYSLSPRFVTRFGSWTVNELRYAYSGENFLDPGVADSAQTTRPLDGANHEFSATIRSGEAFTWLGWSLRALDQTSTGGGDILSRRRSYKADSEYRVNEYVGLLAGLGYDQVLKLAPGGLGTVAGTEVVADADAARLSGMSWNTGVHLNPNPRTDFRFTYGRRYDGNDWSSQLEYEASAGLHLRGAYTVDLQTQQAALAASLNGLVFDPQGQLVDGRTGLPVDPNRVGTTLVQSTFRTQNLVLGLTAERERNSLMLAALYTRRQFVAQLSGRDSSAGLTARFNHQVSPLTDFTVLGTMVRADSDVVSASTTYLGSVALSHRFAEHLRGALSYNRLVRDGVEGLRENAITGTLGAMF